jgi:hypothetical protein
MLDLHKLITLDNTHVHIIPWSDGTTVWLPKTMILAYEPKNRFKPAHERSTWITSKKYKETCQKMELSQEIVKTDMSITAHPVNRSKSYQMYTAYHRYTSCSIYLTYRSTVSKYMLSRNTPTITLALEHWLGNLTTIRTAATHIFICGVKYHWQTNSNGITCEDPEAVGNESISHRKYGLLH